MLFRPYKAKWYTLGWQGIVPRTRPMLANKVATVVSKKLIVNDDLVDIISGDNFKNFLQDSISSKLQEIDKNRIHTLITKINIKDIIKANGSEIDNIAHRLIDSFLSKPLSEFISFSSLSEKTAQNISPIIAEVFASEISLFLNNYIHSGKTLKNALPQSILEKSDSIATYLTDSALNIIKASGRSITVKNAAAKKAIDFKNSIFDDSITDFVKMGILNAFLDDETIANTVKRELPGFLDGIADNPDVKANIKSNITNEINNILRLKLSYLVEKMGSDTIPKLNNTIISKLSSAPEQERIKNAIKKFIVNATASFSHLRLKEVLQKYGSLKYLQGFSLSQYLLALDEKYYINIISEKTAAYILTKKHEISKFITEKSIDTLKSSLHIILEKINIQNTVENKINGFSLSEVEDLLFSFMRTHFKWINILGFVIGFIIGSIQLVITKLI